MKTKIAQTIVAGLAATAVMTLVGLMVAYMGLLKMLPRIDLDGTTIYIVQNHNHLVA